MALDDQITVREYIQAELDERDKRYDQRFLDQGENIRTMVTGVSEKLDRALETEVVRDQAAGERTDEMRKDISTSIPRSEYEANNHEVMIHLGDIQSRLDAKTDSVAQRFTEELRRRDDELEALRRLVWMLVGGATVIGVVVKLLNLKL